MENSETPAQVDPYGGDQAGAKESDDTLYTKNQFERLLDRVVGLRKDGE